MGQIKEYTSSAAEGGLRPSEAGLDARVMQGRRAGAFAAQSGSERAGAYRAVGSVLSDAAGVVKTYQEHEDQQESLMHAANASEVANYTFSKWNEVRQNADPNDPNVAKEFNEQYLQPTLDQYGAMYQTPRGKQQWADFQGRLLETLGTHQMADASVAAGQAAVKNLSTAASNWQSTLSNDPSPMTLELANDETKRMIDAAVKNPNLTAQEVATVRNHGDELLQMNHVASFRAMADANPAAAEDALNKGFGAGTLKGEQIDQLRAYTQAQSRIQIEQKRADEAEGRRQVVEQATAGANKIFAGAIQDDGTLAVGPAYFEQVKQLASQFPNEPTGIARSLFEAGQKANADALAGKWVRSDPNVFADYNERLALPPGDPNRLSLTQVLQASASGSLSKRDTANLQKQLEATDKDPARRDALSQFNKMTASLKSSITKSSLLFGTDPEGDQRYGDWYHDARESFDQAYSNGTWKQALDPRNANFIGQTARQYMMGNKEASQAFQRQLQSGTSIVTPPQKDVPNLATVTTPAPGQPGNRPLTPEEFRAGGANPRKAGESTADYLKRIKGQ